MGEINLLIEGLSSPSMLPRTLPMTCPSRAKSRVECAGGLVAAG